jgi:putative ABC transport system substrate-binding protein
MDTVSSIQQGLREAGFIEHKNVGIDYRWAEGHLDRHPLLVADLVSRQVAVIVAITTPSAVAAKAASKTIPIVFSIAGDPVEFGLVASLNKPGGNVTGVNQLGVGLVAKRLEMIHDLVPTAGAIALLENPASPIARSETEHVREAASSLGLQLHVVNASNERDIDAAFAATSAELLRAKRLPICLSSNPPNCNS